MRICYADWAEMQEKWVMLIGVWKVNWNFWGLDCRYCLNHYLVGDTFESWETPCLSEFEIFTCCCHCGRCSDSTKFRKRFLQRWLPEFQLVSSHCALNHVEFMAYLLYFGLMSWVRISSCVVGGVVGGAISHGPHFSKLKGQTSKTPNDNHHAWCVYCISKGRLSLLSSIMLLLSNESFVCQISEFPLFLSRFFVHEEMSHYSHRMRKLSCRDKTFEMSKLWQVVLMISKWLIHFVSLDGALEVTIR